MANGSAAVGALLTLAICWISDFIPPLLALAVIGLWSWELQKMRRI